MTQILLNADCIDILPYLSFLNPKPVKLVFMDLPYGKTANQWDIKLDLPTLWKLLPLGCVYLFTASNGFEYEVYNSNPSLYKYKWVWNKNNSAGFALAKKRPLNTTEDILVFGSGEYYPQMEERGKIRKKGGYSASENYGITPTISNNNLYYPKSLLNGFSSASQVGKRHPTQKPAELLEYLVKTYTLPGELILDPVMGSGTTGEACLNLGRDFIGIEKDPAIFQSAFDYLQAHERRVLSY